MIKLILFLSFVPGVGQPLRFEVVMDYVPVIYRGMAVAGTPTCRDLAVSVYNESIKPLVNPKGFPVDIIAACEADI